jgi:hypothetical protein
LRVHILVFLDTARAMFNGWMLVLVLFRLVFFLWLFCVLMFLLGL